MPFWSLNIFPLISVHIWKTYLHVKASELFKGKSSLNFSSTFQKILFTGPWVWREYTCSPHPLFFPSQNSLRVRLSRSVAGSWTIFGEKKTPQTEIWKMSHKGEGLYNFLMFAISVSWYHDMPRPHQLFAWHQTVPKLSSSIISNVTGRERPKAEP